MKVTAIQAFRGITSKIHPPVALSQQESQRLLTALTSSFRRQLDNSHTPVHDGESKPICLSPTSGKAHATNVMPTERHLASVLTNPLFTRSEGDSNTTPVRRRSLAHRDPLEVFEDYASRGMANLEIARLCLEAFRNTLVGFASEDRQRRIIEVRPGARILRWLWSSTHATEDIFRQDQRLLRGLAECLVAEGREEALWNWMNKVSTEVIIQVPGKATVTASPQGLLLRSIVAAHLSANAGTGPKAALASFLRATDSSPLETSTSPTPYALLRPAGMYLSRILANGGSPLQAGPTSGALFDRFVQTCNVWAKRSEESALYRIAVLNLHHPIEPKAVDALNFVRYLKKHKDHDMLSTSSKQRTRLLQFLVKTIEVLQLQGSDVDAIWVLEFARQNYEDLLPNAKKDDLVVDAHERPATATEADHVDSLASLDWRSVVSG